MFHCEGEVAVASVAREFGMMYALSSFSTSTFDEIAAAHGGSSQPPAGRFSPEVSHPPRRPPRAFQLYVWRDRAFVREILARARAAGFEALILTADISWFGNREADLRTGFTVPPDYSWRQCAGAAAAPAWTWDWLTHPPYSYALVDQDVSADSIAAYVNAQIEPAFDWEDAAWLCSEWGGPVALKGVVRPDDAKRAVQAGFSTVWVSNHGGRQLETAVPPIDVLPSIRNVVGPDTQLILDGGVRRGVDIAKALALGADGVAIGKPYLYGLAAGGRVGVHKACSGKRTCMPPAVVRCPSSVPHDPCPSLCLPFSVADVPLMVGAQVLTMLLSGFRALRSICVSPLTSLFPSPGRRGRASVASLPIHGMGSSANAYTTSSPPVPSNS
mmetsp:Transcript_14053/g.45087  ORF Transcript_14053/g.45087 Transcript_14053/m.45087 type:complete len:386 (-) Transcript_14053:312-1469(-)